MFHEFFSRRVHIFKKAFWLVTGVLLAAAMILSSCTPATTAEPKPTPAPTPTTPPPATPTPPATTPPATTPPPEIATIVPDPTPPAKQGVFVLSNLTVNPNTIRLFNSANVSVVVTNTGTVPGTYTAVLNVQTAWPEARATIKPSATQEVTLDPGESKTISFSVGIMGNGTSVVSIEGLHERLTVDSQV